jgi:hypothetical protein
MLLPAGAEDDDEYDEADSSDDSDYGFKKSKAKKAKKAPASKARAAKPTAKRTPQVRQLAGSQLGLQERTSLQQLASWSAAMPSACCTQHC